VSTDAAAKRWAETWERGWREHDVDAIAGLYAEGAVHHSSPFREQGDVRSYVDWAFSDEERADVWFGDPVVSGDRAAVPWWAVSASSSGEESLAGVSMLRFGADGLVTEQLDYWNMEPGRHEPHARFGR
jgi:SnoaL-like domain